MKTISHTTYAYYHNLRTGEYEWEKLYNDDLGAEK